MKHTALIIATYFAAQGVDASRLTAVQNLGKNLHQAQISTITKARNLDADEEFLLQVQQDCPTELADFEAARDLATLEVLVECIKDIFNDLLLNCLADVEALAPVAECLIDVGLDDVFLKDRVDSDSDSDSDSDDDDDDDIDDFDDFEFEDLFKIDNIFKYAELDDKYEEIDEIVIDDLDAVACEAYLGESDFPHVFACLLLLDIDDVDDFEDFIEDDLEDSAACQLLADFVDEDDAAEFFEEVFFEKLEKLDDDEEGLCNPDVGGDRLDKLQDIADACAEFDDGELLDNIQDFAANSATTATANLAFSVVAAAVVALM